MAYDEAYEKHDARRDLQDVLEERDAEWWAEQNSDDDAWTVSRSVRKAGSGPTDIARGPLGT